MGGLPDRMLTAHEVAAILGVHHNTVRRLAEKGLLASYRLGKHVRFRREDVIDFLNRSAR